MNALTKGMVVAGTIGLLGLTASSVQADEQVTVRQTVPLVVETGATPVQYVQYPGRVYYRPAAYTYRYRAPYGGVRYFGPPVPYYPRYGYHQTYYYAPVTGYYQPGVGHVHYWR